jgi:hypothetical protein
VNVDGHIAGAGGDLLAFRRRSSPLRIEVLDRPEGVAGAIGSFGISCVLEEGGFWPQLIVTVKGTGTLNGADHPRLIDTAGVPILRRPAGEVTTLPGGGVQRSWRYEIHSLSSPSTLPTMAFGYYDPTRQQETVVDIPCTGSNSPPARLPHQRAALAPLTNTDAEGEPWSSPMAELIALALLIGIGIYTGRALNS